MVSLDLGLLYLREGQSAAVRRLAEEMLPIFEAKDVHREAVSALILFQDAARRETFTIAGIQKLVSYFRDARTDPSLKFGRAS